MLLISLVSNSLSNHGKRHFKLFNNCYVSWDTLYMHCIKHKISPNINKAGNFKGFFFIKPDTLKTK